MTHTILLTTAARRALSSRLPESVAAACYEFIYGALAENPRRVGKRLGPPHDPLYAARRGEFRVVYDIRDEEVVVEVITIMHRRDVYRST